MSTKESVCDVCGGTKELMEVDADGDPIVLPCYGCNDISYWEYMVRVDQNYRDHLKRSKI